MKILPSKATVKNLFIVVFGVYVMVALYAPFTTNAKALWSDVTSSCCDVKSCEKTPEGH